MILEHVCIAMVHNWCFCDFWVGAWWTKKFRRHMLQAFKLSIGKLWNPKLLQGVVNPQQNRLISMGSTPAMGPLYDYIIWRVIPRLVIGLWLSLQPQPYIPFNACLMHVGYACWNFMYVEHACWNFMHVENACWILCGLDMPYACWNYSFKYAYDRFW